MNSVFPLALIFVLVLLLVLIGPAGNRGASQMRALS